MILSKTAKIDFYKWLEKTNHPAWCMMFEGKSQITQNAYFIEWLDSVQIFTNVSLDETNKGKWKYINTRNDRSNLHDWSKCVNINSRREATYKAIEKGNEIYNLRSNPFLN